MHRLGIKTTGLFLLIIGGFFVFSRAVDAATKPVTTFNATGSRLTSWSFQEQVLRKGSVIATGDFDGDGQPEIAAGPIAGADPVVSLYELDGAFIDSFLVLDGKFHGGFALAAGDVDADHHDELIVGAGPGGGPRVEVYTAAGAHLFGFNAYARDFRGGVQVASGDLDSDGDDDIVTMSGYESPGHLRVFNNEGKLTTVSAFPFGKENTFGGTVAVGDVDKKSNDDEIVVTPLGNGQPEILVLSSRGKLLHRFPAFTRSVNRGLSVITANLDDDPEQEIVVSAHQRNKIRGFNSTGSLVTSFAPVGKGFHGDVGVAAGANSTIVTVAVERKTEGRTDLLRYIDIDLTHQLLRYYRLGEKLGEYKISTGKWSMPTPTGTFKTKNKIDTAYSRRYHLYMDYWMAVTPDGLIGIHALPYWIIGGKKVYEGEAHLGTPVSHGCIRLGLKDAKVLYDWAPIGTTVIIHA